MTHQLRSLVLVLAALTLVACDDSSYVSNPALDDDGDGRSENEGDCNDEDPEINFGADELCDTIDNNCDGFIDEYQSSPLYIPCTLPCGSEGEAYCINGGPGRCEMDDDTEYPDECYDWR